MIDCRIGDAFEELEKLKEVDLICTDLPYKETANDWDRFFNYTRFMSLAKQALKENGTFITFASIELASILINLDRKWFSHEIIWIKNKPTGFLNAKKKVMDNHELILIFTKNINQYTYNPQKTTGHTPINNWNKKVSDGTNYNNTKLNTSGGGETDRYPTSTIYFAKEPNISNLKFHPTQKPLGLVELLIKQYSNEEQLVVDPCAGSFVVARACRNLNRNCIAVESKEEYFLKSKELYNI